jgi:hypothetical protein
MHTLYTTSDCGQVFASNDNTNNATTTLYTQPTLVTVHLYKRVW